MTRNGKIARLSSYIRNQLNQRLQDGEEGTTILPWLNALPEALRTLKEHFHSVPISKQNLSEWHLGGFREWQIRQELISHAEQLSESAEELGYDIEAPLLAGKLAIMLTARYAALLNNWNGEADPQVMEQMRLLHFLNLDIALLQKTMQRAGRQQQAFEQAAEAQEQKVIEEAKKEIVAPIWAMMEREPLANIFGGGERGQKLAEIVMAVKYDLPQPEGWEGWKRKDQAMRNQQAKTEARSQTKSKPVKPSQTEPEKIRQQSQAESNPVTIDLPVEPTPDATPE
jgi:hypothetical protein